MKSRGYFRVWVANGKHGNYKSRSDCNTGAIFSQDDCDRHNSQLVESRVWFSGNRNVGSPAYHLEDCTQSTGVEAPFRLRTECYWTDTRFVGWWDPSPGSVSIANSSEGYGEAMLPQVFETLCLPKEPGC